ncbi:MAG: glycoside hydrolase family 15 protein, partial [Asgard group archaeon]
LRESAKMLYILGEYELSKECREASENIRNGILNHLWSEEKDRFLKSFTPFDDTIDISLLGLDFPFEIVKTDDEKMKSTAEQIEKAFNYNIGGIGRYPNDVYYGGNPWILTTLWLAIYYARLGDRAKASNLINFIVDKTPELGLMSEQLDKNTGELVSAHPLGWSHAMFVIAMKELEKK